MRILLYLVFVGFLFLAGFALAAPPSYLLLSCPGLIANYTATAQAELVLSGAQTCSPTLVAVNLTLPNGTIWYYNYQNYPPSRSPNNPTLPTCLGSSGPQDFLYSKLSKL